MPKPYVGEVRKQQILKAAAQVLGERGFETLRMEDVAQASGLSKATIYLYFKDKDALYDQLMEEFFKQNTPSAPEKAQTLFDHLMACYQERSPNREAWGQEIPPLIMEFYASSNRNPQRRELILRRMGTYIERMTNLFQDSMDKGQLKSRDAQTAAVVVAALFEGASIFQALSPGQSLDQDIVGRGLDLILEALSPRKPAQR